MIVRIAVLTAVAMLRGNVVIELKAVPFQPAFLGRLGRYIAAVDDLLGPVAPYNAGTTPLAPA